MDDIVEPNTSSKNIPSKICEAPFSINFAYNNGEFTMENGNSVKIEHSLESMGCKTKISSTTSPFERSSMRPKTSVVWTFFERIDDIIYKCCICKTLMPSHSNSTIDFLEHVKWNHPKEYREAFIGKQLTCEVPHSFESDGGELEDYEGELEDYEGELEDDEGEYEDDGDYKGEYEDDEGEYGDYKGEYEDGGDYKGEYEDDEGHIPKNVKTNRMNYHERIVWENVKIISPSLCKCNICNKMLAYKDSSATNLLRHMKHKHPEKYEEQLSSKDIIIEISEWASQSAAQSNENTHESQDVPNNRKKKSIVWKYMEVVAPKKAKCVLCNLIFSFSTSYATSHMLKHLRVKHAIFPDERKVVVAQKSQDVPRKRKTWSVIWRYMKLVGTSKVKCVLCNKILNYQKHSSTSHIFQHLKVEHAIVNDHKADIERKKSIVRKYLKRVNPLTVKCMLCNKTLKVQRDYSDNMFRHLDRVHTNVIEKEGGISRCSKNVLEDELELIRELSQGTSQSGAQALSVNEGQDVDNSQEYSSHEPDMSSDPNQSTDISQEAPRTGMRRKRSLIWKYMKLVGTSKVKCVLCDKILYYSKRSGTSISKHLQFEHSIVKDYKPGIERKQSVVWRYMKRVNHLTVKCMLCNKTLKYKTRSNTGNVLRHLDRVHDISIENEEGISKCSENVLEDELKLRSELSDGTSQSGAQALSVNEGQDVDNSQEYSSHETDMSSDPNQSTDKSQEFPRKGRKGSIIWKYMKKVDPSNVKCVLCNTILKYWKHSTTSHIFQHLQVEHAIVNDVERKQSIVWKYMKRVNPLTAKCMLCNKTFKVQRRGKTGNMLTHLRHFHSKAIENEEGISKCSENILEDELELISELSQGTSQSGAQVLSVNEGQDVDNSQEYSSHEPDMVSDPDKIKKGV